MDSDENRFKVSLIVKDKVTRQCPQTITFEEKGELKRIQTFSDENRFNVSLIVKDKVTRQCPQTITFEEKGELKRIQT